MGAIDPGADERLAWVDAEAVVAVEHILGENPPPVDYGKVPWVVYTHPEVAWSGLTEAQARGAGHDVVVHKHSFAGNGRAMILGETDGLVKIVAEKDGPILGNITNELMTPTKFSKLQ